MVYKSNGVVAQTAVAPIRRVDFHVDRRRWAADVEVSPPKIKINIAFLLWATAPNGMTPPFGRICGPARGPNPFEVNLIGKPVRPGGV